jgi:hypothetical protein
MADERWYMLHWVLWDCVPLEDIDTIVDRHLVDSHGYNLTMHTPQEWADELVALGGQKPVLMPPSNPPGLVGYRATLKDGSSGIFMFTNNLAACQYIQSQSQRQQ